VVSLLVATAPARATTGCDIVPAAGDRTVILSVGGQARTTRLHIPAGLALRRRVPLVLALHGYGGTGPQMERYSRLTRVADRQRFLVAFPSSQGLYWNSTANPTLPDDVRFLAGLIDSLQATYCVDRQRIFATGVSNGGSMVALVACRLAGVLAAIAPVAGEYSGQPPCHPQRPVSVLEIHGTADRVVPYYGPGGRRTADGLPPFVDQWVARDGCRGRPTVATIAIRATAYAWTGCRAGTEVEHIRIEGGVHQWPGATPPDPGPAATICAACRIWSFFAGLHPTHMLGHERRQVREQFRR
jgi:polyhydroxybutyrate depolymerase